MMTALALSAAPIATAQQAQGGGTGTTSQGRATNTVTASGQGTSVSMTNVRLELTITDQTGTGQPVKKVMSLLLAERGNGRVRSQSVVEEAGSHSSYVVQLNADAFIQRIEGDRVRTGITVEYAPVSAEGQSMQRGSPLNQTVDVVLTSGKPLTIVEASDPRSDRKVTLEATATIVR
jgi:hypothetical protein